MQKVHSVCYYIIADNTGLSSVESLLLSKEDKPQSHRTVREIFTRGRDLSIISFGGYSQRSASQVLQEKARSTAD